MKFPCGGFAIHSGTSGVGRQCGNELCDYCNNPLKYINGNWQFPSIECPKCKILSYNTNDIKHKFCGNCDEWHDYMDGKENKYPDSVKKIAKVLLEEIEKYYPGIIKKTFDSFGFPNREGSPAQERAEMCVYIELLKAGAFNIK